VKKYGTARQAILYSQTHQRQQYNTAYTPHNKEYIYNFFNITNLKSKAFKCIIYI